MGGNKTAAASGQGIEVVACTASHSEMWDSYVESADGGSFYHLFGWKEVNEKNFGHRTFYLAALENGKFRGVFPLVYLQSRLFGKIFCSMPFVNYGGLCADNTAAESALLERAASLVRECGADYMEIRSLSRLSADLPTSDHKVSLTLDLSPDPDKLWNGLNTKQRTNIRRAYKNGLEARSGQMELLDEFYRLFSESWRDLGTPVYRKDYFRNILQMFPDSTRIFIVTCNGEPVAGALNGYYKGIVEGMWAASPARHRKLQANYVLYWEMIKHACEEGFSSYHLGRSTADSGSESFKAKWNAYPRQLYWQYHLNRATAIPQLNVKNPKYQLAIKAWSRLPVSFTEFIGPFFASHIP